MNGYPSNSVLHTLESWTIFQWATKQNGVGVSKTTRKRDQVTDQQRQFKGGLSIYCDRIIHDVWF